MLQCADTPSVHVPEPTPVIPGARLLVQMEARAPERNLLRAYDVNAGQDLFGDWFVQIRFGRIGKRGRRLDRIFLDEALAKCHIRRSLRRRASASTRIGASYRVIRADGDWLEEMLGTPGSV